MAAGQGNVLTFRVGERRLGLPAADVFEVVRQPRITRVPHSPPALAGVASLRGEVVPVVALGRLLGDDAVTASGGRLVVIGGERPLALAVDEVLGLTQAEAQSGEIYLSEAGGARVLPLHELIAAQFAGFARARTGAQAAPARKTELPRAADIALLGFVLAGQPYALPLEQVREVLAIPADIAALPKTDAAMLGVMSLRGALLPVVSSRALLGLPAEPTNPGARVVVASIGDARVGLVVDRLTSILRAPVTAIGPVPAVLNRGAGEAHIDAMLRLADGGLVSVLSPERLFREDSVAQILQDGRQRGAQMTAQQADLGERFLIFTLGQEHYGLPIGAVEEVARLPEPLTRVPNAPAFVAGVMNLRGEAAPVIDQRRRFGVEGDAPAGRRRAVVTRIGGAVTAFAVDGVTEILAIPAERIAATPDLTADAGQVFDRVAQLEDGRVILLVDPRGLLDRAESDLVAELAQRTAAHL
ncbi:chemotaxis protein CheW [Phenylobacterium deserti]|uniref:Chemotaxis protein n=1 Tax=Phenylobacterium deserti TaxID=1914756 RepID=A0A328ATI9_9CAUL|nr:chemotaxis protein CheW [Phenylobacterium deserti]RAK57551.1 chemotaxis protein [Phenylobacterium deserti]